MGIDMKFLAVLIMSFFFFGCMNEPKRDPVMRNPDPVKFVPSDGYHRYRGEFDDLNNRFFREHFQWDSTDVLLVLDHGFYADDYYVGKISIKEPGVHVYKIFTMESDDLAQYEVKFETCVLKYVTENESELQDKCHKKRVISDALYSKMMSFLSGEKASIIGGPRECPGALHMFLHDSTKYFYFDMIAPKCFDDNVKNDPRIPEYVGFYNEMAALLIADFDECRWDNFGNKEKIIRECGKFNWRWKRKYPDLVK